MSHCTRPTRAEGRLFGNAGENHVEERERLAMVSQIETLMGARDRVSARKALREMVAENPEVGMAAILDILKTGSGASQDGLLARMLVDDGYFSRLICDGAFPSLEQAVHVARRVAKVSPIVNVDLLKAVWQEGRVAASRPAALRVLTVIENMDALSRTLPILVQIARSCDDNIIRSKAALLASRAQADGRLARDRLRDPDPRVRSNAVEALWGLRTATATAIFQELASNAGEHHRVVANAIVGLYLAGDKLGAAEHLKCMASSTSHSFRKASAWVAGYLQQMRFLPDAAAGP